MVEFGVFDNVSPAYFLGDGCDFADFRGVEFEPVRDGCFAVTVGAFFDVNGVEVGPNDRPIDGSLCGRGFYGYL